MIYTYHNYYLFIKGIETMSDNLTYIVNIKQEPFSTIFNNINEVFNGNYLKFISEIKATKPYLVDMLILMRKYQYYIESIYLNGAEMASFTKENSGSNCRVMNMKQMLNVNNENNFEIKIMVVPKFKKNEISFKIPDDYLDLTIELKVFCNEEIKMNIKNANVNITNLKGLFDDAKYEKLNKVLNKVFDVFNEDNKTLQPFAIVNKYLNYIENYLQNLVGTKNELSDKWTQEEQYKLEELLIKYRDIKNPTQKMEKIASELTSKTLKQIIIRYKELVYAAKAKDNKNNKKEEVNSITSQNKEEPKPKKEEPKTKKEETKLKKEETKLKKEETKPKKEYVSKTQSETSSVNTSTIKPKVIETTDDIINEIIRIYNTNYKNKNLSTMLEEYEPTNDSYSISEGEEEEEEEGEEREENPEEQSEENKELIDMYLSSNLQPTIPKENLLLLQNILSFGEKYEITLHGLKMTSVALAEINQIKLIIKCAKCNQVAFDSNYQRISKKDTLFYMGTTCPRCDNQITTIFKSTFLHEANMSNAGTVYMEGGILFDVLPSTYALQCYHCQEIKNAKIRTGGLHFNDSKCRKCNSELAFYINSVSIEKAFSSNLFFLENCKLLPFSIFNYVIKDDIDLNNYVKRYDKVIQVGKPLPNYGTCKHFKQSFRWFRFSCCNKVFPCDMCHNETVTSHNNEFAKTVLCGFCAFEQTSNNKICSKCGKSFSKSEIAGGYWEGGKGCRNKDKMNSKDSHKYTGSSMKTISRRKIKKMQNK